MFILLLSKTYDQINYKIMMNILRKANVPANVLA